MIRGLDYDVVFPLKSEPIAKAPDLAPDLQVNIREELLPRRWFMQAFTDYACAQVERATNARAAFHLELCLSDMFRNVADHVYPGELDGRVQARVVTPTEAMIYASVSFAPRRFDPSTVPTTEWNEDGTPRTGSWGHVVARKLCRSLWYMGAKQEGRLPLIRTANVIIPVEDRLAA